MLVNTMLNSRIPLHEIAIPTAIRNRPATQCMRLLGLSQINFRPVPALPIPIKDNITGPAKMRNQNILELLKVGFIHDCNIVL
jgi:hypothetical protein